MAPKIKRFKGIGGVKQYVARALLELEDVKTANPREAAAVAAAKFSGCRLMADLITSNVLEKRLRRLEGEQLLKAARKKIAPPPEGRPDSVDAPGELQ